MHSFVTSKNAQWPRLIWPTLYIFLIFRQAAYSRPKACFLLVCNLLSRCRVRSTNDKILSRIAWVILQYCLSVITVLITLMPFGRRAFSTLAIIFHTCCISAEIVLPENAFRLQLSLRWCNITDGVTNIAVISYRHLMALLLDPLLFHQIVHFIFWTRKWFHIATYLVVLVGGLGVTLFKKA